MDTTAHPGAAAFVDEAIYGRRADEPWPDPDLSLIAAEPIPPPPVPANVLPPRWAAWTMDAAEGAGAPHAFTVCATLSATGALIGNSRWASPWDPWREPPAINVALVGRPSSGKSPAQDQVVALLTRIEAALNTDIEDRRREAKRLETETKERIKLWESEVRDAAKLGNPAPALPAGLRNPAPVERRRVYSTEPTVEKAGRLSASNPRGLLLQRDELAGWLASMDRYAATAGGDRPFWLQAYGGRAWTPDRVKDGDDEVHIPHLLWSILGTIQPDRVASLLMGGDDDGLSSRFLYCWPAPLPPRRPDRVADAEGAFARLMRLRMMDWPEAPAPRVVRFSPSAAAVIQEWRCEAAKMEGEASGLMLSWIGKLPGLAVRLALILELLAWSETPDGTPEPVEIGEHAAVAAITFLVDFALPMARRTFGAAALPEAERDARRLARWLLKQNPVPESVNAKALRRMADGPAIPDSARMDAALAELAAAGWCRPAPIRAGDTAGRARKDWALNPALRGRRQ